MCGCKAGKATYTAPATFNISATTESSEQSQECFYSSQQLNSWYDIVKCYKDKGLYIGTHVTKKQLHAYMGTILSALNYQDNICYFQKELEEIESFVMVVISSGLC